MSEEYDSEKNKMSNEPDVNRLQAELESILEDANKHTARRQEYDDIRLSRWEGQSADGRKHEDLLGYKPTPWEGASDTRNRLADMIVNFYVAMAMEAFQRSTLDVIGIERGDSRKASYWRDCIKYFVKQKMIPELRREVEILAQEVFSSTPAIGILGVYWQQETIMRMRNFTIQDIATMVESMGGTPEALEEIIMLMRDPDMESEALPVMKNAFPGVKDSVLKKGLREFRETGETKLPAPVVHENRPRFVAHRLNEDIFLDTNTTDLDRCRIIMRREWFSETELREKIVTEGFNPDFVEEVLSKTESTSGIGHYDNHKSRIRNASILGQSGDAEYDDLYEIFYAYTRVYDEDTNVPAIFCTAFSKHVSESYGKHVMLEYGHNQMPFVLFTRERLSRSIFDSRGIPELVMTNQFVSKINEDLQIDASQISCIPPLMVNARRGGLNTIVAPASQLTISRPDDIGWLNPPPVSQGSIEVQKSSEESAYKYFGMIGDPNDMIIIRQTAMNRWLDSWREAFSQALALCQQYLPPEFVSRLTGGAPEEIQISQDDIQGKYDLMVRFNVEQMFPEFMEKKLQAVTQLTQFDTMGQIDRNALVKIASEQIDPMLADEIVVDRETASQKEIEDEQSSWVKIMNEIEPFPKQGVNFELRMQTAQQIVQTSQQLQQKMQESPLVKQLSENRMKYLQFGISQRENANIGRVGVKPVMQGY